MNRCTAAVLFVASLTFFEVPALQAEPNALHHTGAAPAPSLSQNQPDRAASGAVDSAASESAVSQTEAEAEASHSAHGEDQGRIDAVHDVTDSRVLEIPWPNAHLMKQVHLPSLGTFTVAGIRIELAITKHVVFLWVAAVLVLVVAVAAAQRARRGGLPRGLHNGIEAVVVFMRDEVAVPSLGERYGRWLLPYLLSVFLFILTCNLLGLVPYASTATGNISVTAGLATLSFLLIQGVAIRDQGLRGWLTHLTGGVHWVLWPIMVPIEIIGLFTKPFALCIRLFANMTAGHIVALSVIGLIFIFHHVAIAGLAVPFNLFVCLLEILVAFIQAYIFTMLTAVFTGLGVHSDHPEGEEHERAESRHGRATAEPTG